MKSFVYTIVVLFGALAAVAQANTDTKPASEEEVVLEEVNNTEAAPEAKEKK